MIIFYFIVQWFFRDDLITEALLHVGGGYVQGICFQLLPMLAWRDSDIDILNRDCAMVGLEILENAVRFMSNVFPNCYPDHSNLIE